MVVGGSLSQGLDVRLAREVSTEEQAVGSYAVVHGESKRFFSMITDVELGATSEEITLNPPDLADDFLRAVHVGTSTFGLIHLSPMLVLDESGRAAAGQDRARPLQRGARRPARRKSARSSARRAMTESGRPTSSTSASRWTWARSR